MLPNEIHICGDTKSFKLPSVDKVRARKEEDTHWARVQDVMTVLKKDLSGWKVAFILLWRQKVHISHQWQCVRLKWSEKAVSFKHIVVWVTKITSYTHKHKIEFIHFCCHNIKQLHYAKPISSQSQSGRPARWSDNNSRFVTLTHSTVHLEVRVLILSCFCLTAAYKALYTQQHAASTANACYKLNVMVCPWLWSSCIAVIT